VLKRALIVLILIFSFIIPSFSSPTMTLEQEANLIDYIIGGANEYISSVDWFRDKSYTPELDHIQSMFTKYGWKKEECYVALLGAEMTPGEKPIPFAIGIILTGKADPETKPFWKFLIYLQPKRDNNKNVPDNRNTFGI
jgi:hypothetical protein